MDRFLLVTIDTEADSFENWGVRLPFEFRSVPEGIGDRLMPLFQKYGIHPTFLISHEVLENEPSVRFLRSLPDCELGTHCHWDAPDCPLYPGKSRYYVQGKFPYEAELRQMKSLTELFSAQIGRRPLSFRAGRFGAGIHTGKILFELGYRQDSSIVPHVAHGYREGEIFPDHTQCPELPYTISDDGDLTRPGTLPLLEIPVTVRYVHSRFNPFGLRPGMYAWLRPSYSSWATMARIAASVVKESVSVMNVMFHNVEFVPGRSPYAADEHGVRLLLDRLERLFAFCRKKGVRPVTMSELGTELMKTR